jgi:hypothetical protein
MQQHYEDFEDQEYRPYRERPRSRTWLWVLLVLGLLFVLPCAGLLGVLAYIGAKGPDTAVYAGNQVPARYLATMKSVGALDEGETILYFYSDALLEIRDGFYFVSDKKVATYSDEAGDPPLSKATFAEIADLDLQSSDNFFVDGQITLELKDGRVLAFPISSENKGDQRFFDAIKSRVDELDDGDHGQPGEAGGVEASDDQTGQSAPAPGAEEQKPAAEQPEENPADEPDTKPAEPLPDTPTEATNAPPQDN